MVNITHRQQRHCARFAPYVAPAHACLHLHRCLLAAQLCRVVGCASLRPARSSGSRARKTFNRLVTHNIVDHRASYRGAVAARYLYAGSAAGCAWMDLRHRRLPRAARVYAVLRQSTWIKRSSPAFSRCGVRRGSALRSVLCHCYALRACCAFRRCVLRFWPSISIVHHILT